MNGFDLFAEWSATSGKDDPELTEQKWNSIRPPYTLGWRQLAALAQERSGGAFNAAAYEFEPVVGDSDTDAQGDGTDAGESLTEFEAARKAVLGRWAYREPTGEWIRIADGAILKREVFNDTTDGLLVARLEHSERLAKWEKAPAKDRGPRPLAKQAHQLLKTKALRVQAVTYLPSKGTVFRTDMRGGGLVFNLYAPPARPFEAKETLGDGDVQHFLDLMDWVFPDPVEKALMFDYMAFIAQNPGHKIEWAPVLFSIMQGVGKDTVLKVLRHGVVGEENMEAIAPARLESEFNADWAPKQVILVTELPSHHKRDLYDRLKDLVASGAGAMSVNPKGLARFSMPNLHCWVFTTNKPDALNLEVNDRRFNIIRAREERMPAELRDRLNAWFDWNEKTREGSKQGYLLAGEWLRRRKVSEAFSPFECSLLSASKRTMMTETLPGPARELYDLLTDGEWGSRQLMRPSEIRARLSSGGGRSMSYPDIRKALELAGFTLPEKRDLRERIKVGSKKIEVWVRDFGVQSGDQIGPSSGPWGPIGSWSHRLLAEALVSELKQHAHFEAEAIQKDILSCGPRSVE